jgi:hypothetical protein
LVGGYNADTIKVTRGWIDHAPGAGKSDTLSNFPAFLLLSSPGILFGHIP